MSASSGIFVILVDQMDISIINLVLENIIELKALCLLIGINVRLWDPQIQMPYIPRQKIWIRRKDYQGWLLGHEDNIKTDYRGASSEIRRKIVYHLCLVTNIRGMLLIPKVHFRLLPYLDLHLNMYISLLDFSELKQFIHIVYNILLMLKPPNDKSSTMKCSQGNSMDDKD